MCCNVRRVRRQLSLLAVCTVAVLVLSACKQTTGTPVPSSVPSVDTPVPTAMVPEPTETSVPSTETSAETPTAQPPQALSPEPQVIEFQAEDGQTLSGTYYPAATDSAPCVILMHWAPGDQTVWALIAPWLQNRVDLAGIAPPTDATWHDYTWFPPVPEGESYAVFTFTFRGCEGGCREFDREGWLLDAKAAVETARTLPGVDADRIATVGASIGADGAVNSCAEGCRGAFSLSPGSYLTVDYATDVARLASSDPPVPVKCVAAEGDTTSADACAAASGDSYEMVIHPGDDHGMQLIRPDADPETLQSILDFLAWVLG